MKTSKKQLKAEYKAYKQSSTKAQSFYTDDIAFRETIELKLAKIKKIVSKKIDQIFNSEINFNYSGTLAKASPLDIVRIISEIQLESDLEYSIKNISNSSQLEYSATLNSLKSSKYKSNLFILKRKRSLV